MPPYLDTLAQLGIGGYFAWLIVREVLNFLKTAKKGPTNGAAGDKPVEFWEQRQRENTMTVITTTIVPILHNQTTILNEMRQGQVRMTEILLLLQQQALRG